MYEHQHCKRAQRTRPKNAARTHHYKDWLVWLCRPVSNFIKGLKICGIHKKICTVGKKAKMQEKPVKKQKADVTEVIYSLLMIMWTCQKSVGRMCCGCVVNPTKIELCFKRKVLCLDKGKHCIQACERHLCNMEMVVLWFWPDLLHLDQDGLPALTEQ